MIVQDVDQIEKVDALVVREFAKVDDHRSITEEFRRLPDLVLELSCDEPGFAVQEFQNRQRDGAQFDFERNGPGRVFVGLKGHPDWAGHNGGVCDGRILSLPQKLRKRKP